MTAEHLRGYFSGTISFKEKDLDDIVAALNFLVSRNAKLVVGRSTLNDDMITLAFGFKEDDNASPLLSLFDGGATIGDVKSVFEGCDLKCQPLKPSVGNRAHLALAKELEALTEVMPFSAADIMPKRPRSASHGGGGAAGDTHAGGSAAGADDHFAGLIGLDEQVRTFRELATTVSEYGRGTLENLNVVLTGDPGVGKSSVAQAFARYAKQQGLVTGPFRQVSAENLIAKYAGQTPTLVKDQWMRARGGVFLLDEAYRLSQDTGGYGREAINTLNELMERDRDTLVICAGYRKEMADFLAQNPGLAQRFGFRIDFPSYDEDVLLEIFLNFARNKGFDVSEDARKLLPEAMRALKRDPHFANGRSVRNLFDRCIIKQACYRGGGKVLSKEALELAMTDLALAPAASAKRVGFLS